MKNLVVFVLFLFCACSCVTGRCPNVETPKLPEPDTSNVLTAWGYKRNAHACPVVTSNGTKVIITARHILEERSDTGEMISGIVLSTDDGKVVYAIPDGYWRYGDAGSLIADPESPYNDEIEYYQLGDLPEPGQEVWFVNFMDEKAKVMKSIKQKTTVSHIVGRVVILNDSPLPGASGGCLLDAEGIVRGFIIVRIRTDGEPSGGAILPPQ